MDAAEAIPIRRMDFEFSDDVDLVFIEGDPGLSYFFVGAWMMLPYLEPFLIRTIQAATPLIEDADLRARMTRFCAQEGQHFRQHARLNEVVRRVHPSGPKLAELEKAVEAEFAAWSAEKPLKFNLAYGEGFESMTCAGARTQIQLGMFGWMKEPIRSLMYWHILEEIEHRSVCFEVYEAVVGDYLYRSRMSLWFQRHYFAWCGRFAREMIAADPETMARYDTPEWARVRKRRAAAYQRDYLPRLLGTFMPWYDPGRVRLPDGFSAARAEFSARAVSVQ
ncbi:MAG: metal-dependent hydrolase [Phenylobacterium sp.]|uniref:metal-dependent hydrolase n=1 Tax=Phenylobacterium sp. TaxID=1871053 RepID=UPI001A571012|nr:metal-dependent hydrolase [Phenylobacterium sp.]MBL8772979.1 metal-dependent hydrolase [Phenylobacterium sp.]